jgi:hypothetical protein
MSQDTSQHAVIQAASGPGSDWFLPYKTRFLYAIDVYTLLTYIS